MLCLAAQRKPYGKLVVVSPDDGFEFDINEDVLNIHMIELGQFCRIEVENNSPVQFVSEEDGLEGLTVTVEDDLALVHGVTGILKKGIALFYQTEQFGKVACRDEKPGEVGSEHELIVSRLPEGKRQGMYAKCVWGAVAKGTDEAMDTLNAELEEMKLDELEESEGSNRSSDVDDEETSESSSTVSDSNEDKKVIGVITGVHMNAHKAFIACSQSYPGIDGIIEYRKKNPLKIGDWVEVRFSEEQYEMVLPTPPSPDTPRFFTNRYTKLPRQKEYFVKVVNKTVEVSIRGVSLAAEHKKGDNVMDQFLGVISDKNSLLSDGASTNKIIIGRVRAFAAKDGELSTWVIRKVIKITEEPKELVEEESTSSKENETKQKKIEIKKTTKAGPSKGYGKTPFRGIGFSEKTVYEDEMVTKRAVVTSVKPGAKGGTAFLWLLDDHKQSIFFMKPNQQLQPGHFFDGMFYQNEDKWECKKYRNPLGKLLDGFKSRDGIEFQIDVSEYFPETESNMAPESYHKFLGRIVDKYKQLPMNCSEGVRVSVRLCKLQLKNKWCWIITRVYQTKYARLLVEFFKAWNTDGVRGMVCLKSFKEYKELKSVLDIPQRYTSVTTKKEKSVDDDGESKKNYAWVTKIDGDIVTVVVLPRNKDQMMSQVTNKEVYEGVASMTPNRLFEVILGKNGQVTKMLDCSQIFSADENGQIEFKFISTEANHIAKNIALVDAVDMPKWLGKLMFFLSERDIPKQPMLWKGKFRILSEKNPFIDDKEVIEHRVCFVNFDDVERLPYKELVDIQNSQKSSEPSVENQKMDEGDDEALKNFIAKLKTMHHNTVFAHFKQVCSVLRNKEIVEIMKRKGVYTETIRSVNTPRF